MSPWVDELLCGESLLIVRVGWGCFRPGTNFYEGRGCAEYTLDASAKELRVYIVLRCRVYVGLCMYKLLLHRRNGNSRL